MAHNGHRLRGLMVSSAALVLLASPAFADGQNQSANASAQSAPSSPEDFMSTGVVIGNSLFGFSARNSGQYFALDANTGQTQWLSEARIAENAAVVRAGDLWFALTTEAQLLVARANPKQLEILKT